MSATSRPGPLRLALYLGVFVGSALVINGFIFATGAISWSRTLANPPWSPPGPVIGTVWVVLFALMARMAIIAQWTLNMSWTAGEKGDMGDRVRAVLARREEVYQALERHWRGVAGRPRFSDRGRRHVAATEARYQAWRQAAQAADDAARALAEETLDRAPAARLAYARAAEALAPASEALGAEAVAFLEQNRGDADRIVGQGLRDAGLIRWNTLAATLVGLALSGALSVLLLRRLSRTLTRVSGILAQGAGHVSAAAMQVASSSQALAAGTHQQSATLQQISASVEQLSGTTGTTTAQAEQGRDSAQGARQAAEQGASQVGELRQWCIRWPRPRGSRWLAWPRCAPPWPRWKR